jgi:hypothetical protein
MGREDRVEAVLRLDHVGFSIQAVRPRALPLLLDSIRELGRKAKHTLERIQDLVELQDAHPRPR